MADNVTVDNGTGTDYVVATDERSIGGTSVHLQRYLNTGGSTIAAGRASVTVTSGEAVVARETRHHVVLYALSTNTADIDVGPSGVASGSGFPMAPGASMTLETAAAIHADAASGTQTLAYIEVYS